LPFSPVGGPLREAKRQRYKVQSIALLELSFPDTVLLGMVQPTKADRISVRRFQSDTAVGFRAHMGTFDRALLAAGYRTGMPPHPCAMTGTAPLVPATTVAVAPIGQAHHTAFFFGVTAALRARTARPSLA